MGEPFSRVRSNLRAFTQLMRWLVRQKFRLEKKSPFAPLSSQPSPPPLPTSSENGIFPRWALLADDELVRPETQIVQIPANVVLVAVRIWRVAFGADGENGRRRRGRRTPFSPTDQHPFPLAIMIKSNELRARSPLAGPD